MKWFWSVVIIISALVVALVNFVFPDFVARPFLMLWFLLICPGMMLIRFLGLQEVIMEWMLAIALSLAVEATIIGVQVYTSRWSYPLTLIIIICMCIVGEIVRFAQMNLRKRLF